MKVSQHILDDVNAERVSNDPDQAILAHLWDVAWRGPCFDRTCRGEHEFRVIIAIGSQEDTLPEPRLALWEGRLPKPHFPPWEDITDVMVPMTKAAVAELIADLRACLDTLP